MYADREVLAASSTEENARVRKRVLIAGTVGGVGTMTLQLARWLECEVVPLYSKWDAVLAKYRGADVVVMYGEERDWWLT